MSKTKTYLEMKKKREVPKEIVGKSKEFARIKKLFTQALKSGPKTVPEMAAILKIPSAEAMYWMMTLRKYEIVVETDEVTDDGYYKYTLVKRGK